MYILLGQENRERKRHVNVSPYEQQFVDCDTTDSGVNAGVVDPAVTFNKKNAPWVPASQCIDRHCNQTSSSQTRATVHDSAAGLGQTLRTGRPLVSGLSSRGVSGPCVHSSRSVTRLEPARDPTERYLAVAIETEAHHSRRFPSPRRDPSAALFPRGALGQQPTTRDELAFNWSTGELELLSIRGNEL